MSPTRETPEDAFYPPAIEKLDKPSASSSFTSSSTTQDENDPPTPQKARPGGEGSARGPARLGYLKYVTPKDRPERQTLFLEDESIDVVIEPKSGLPYVDSAGVLRIPKGFKAHSALNLARREAEKLAKGVYAQFEELGTSSHKRPRATKLDHEQKYFLYDESDPDEKMESIREYIGASVADRPEGIHVETGPAHLSQASQHPDRSNAPPPQRSSVSNYERYAPQPKVLAGVAGFVVGKDLIMWLAVLFGAPIPEAAAYDLAIIVGGLAAYFMPPATSSTAGDSKREGT